VFSLVDAKSDLTFDYDEIFEEMEKAIARGIIKSDVMMRKNNFKKI